MHCRTNANRNIDELKYGYDGPMSVYDTNTINERKERLIKEASRRNSAL